MKVFVIVDHWCRWLPFLKQPSALEILPPWCAQTGHPLKLPSPTKLARLGHFPPASQAGRLADPVFYVYVFSLVFATFLRVYTVIRFLLPAYNGLTSAWGVYSWLFLTFACGLKLWCFLRGVKGVTDENGRGLEKVVTVGYWSRTVVMDILFIFQFGRHLWKNIYSRGGINMTHTWMRICKLRWNS